jgi:hypothetical protein
MKPKNTADHTTSYRKLLLYAHHGWGKTTQMKHYQLAYGPGLILSGESGLSSIRGAGIDYLPFTSWDGTHDPANDKYSFKEIVRWIATSSEFRDAQYKWIGVDSLTELSDMALAEMKVEAERKAAIGKGKVNGFEVWGDYAAQMIGACKWVRDLPMHVIVTALAKEQTDANNDVEYWPMVAGKQVQQQLPGIFDCVLCGVRKTSGDPENGAVVERYIITDEVKGWHGKVRDENHRLRTVERASDVTKLFKRMDMTDVDYAKWLATAVADLKKKD